MILGIQIQNYCVLENIKAGMLENEVGRTEKEPRTAFSAGIDPVFPFTELVAVVGRNDTGKSIFFDALSFLSDSLVNGCVAASSVASRGGFSRLISNKEKAFFVSSLFSLSVYVEEEKKDYYVSYEAEMDCDRNGKPFFSREKVRAAEKKENTSFFDVLTVENGRGEILLNGEMKTAGIADTRISAVSSYGSLLEYPFLTVLYQEISHWFFCDFSSSGKKDSVPAPGGHRHLNTDGSNVENVLKYMEKEDPKAYQLFTQKIKDKIPQVRHKSQLPDSFMGSPAKLFLYLLLLEDVRPRPLLCLETPDSELYHDMVEVLAQELRAYVVNRPHSQVFLTTHNPYILESLAPQEVWNFERKEEKGKKVSVRCMAQIPIILEMYEQGVGMGAIWYAGHFDDE